MVKKPAKLKTKPSGPIIIGSPTATPITPQAKKEFQDLDRSAKQQVIGQREAYAQAALGVFQAWVGFTIVFIIAQIVMTVFGSPLKTPEFIAVVVTGAGSTVGLAYMVGKFLFPQDGTKDWFNKK